MPAEESILRMVVLNQRGGCAKTTTAVTIARCLADAGKKVLLVDTDPQASINVVLGLRPSGSQGNLSDFLIKRISLRECVMSVHPHLDVMPSSRETRNTEDIISTQMARERYLELAFRPAEEGYDAVIFDVSPAISWFQTCALYYTRKVLIPVAMEPLSVQGATAAAQVVRSMNEMFDLDPPVYVIGLLPVIVNRRLQMTETVLSTIEAMAERQNVPMLPPIRTDTAVTKAARHKKFLADFDKTSKALEDYLKVTQILLSHHDTAVTIAHDQAKAS